MSFQDFLPKNSILMAKSARAARASETSSESPDGIPLAAEIRSEGNPAAELVFIGFEAGATSDRPFSVGASDLLDKMIAAMGLKSSDVFSASILPDSSSSIWQHATLASLKPRMWIALGEDVAQWLLREVAPETSDFEVPRGRFLAFREGQMIVTYHPEELLAKGALKRDAWTDLQKVAKELGIVIPAKR